MKKLRTQVLLFFMMVISVTAFGQVSQLTTANYQEILDQSFSANEPGATLIVAQNGKILFKGAAGMADLENNVSMTADHVLRIGSITKQFTAVAILMLMEEGKLGLQDDLTKFIPDYPTLGKKITVEHLLTHTSGIQSMTSMPNFFDNIRNDMTTSEMIDVFKNEPMNFDPGEEFRYNNSGYFLLGVIIEKVSGMSYADFIQKRIFDKVRMKNSYYGNASQIIPNRASGYEMNNGSIVNASYLSMTIPYAAGSLLSTVEDLYKWHKAIHNYELIKKENLEKAMTSYTLNNGEKTDYGYGWGIANVFETKMIAHSGGINGFVTNALYLPKYDLFVASFSNGKDPEGLTERIAGITLGKYPMVKKISLNAEELKAFSGKYEITASDHVREIRVDRNHLTSKRTGGRIFHVFPFEKNKFFFENSLTIFEFVKDDSGKVVGMISHTANGKSERAKRTGDVVERKTITLDEKTLQLFVGEYNMGNGDVLNVFLEDKALWAQPPGDSKLQLHAASNSSFYLKEMDANVSFEKDDKGIFSKIKIMLGPEVMVGKRKTMDD